MPPVYQTSRNAAFAAFCVVFFSSSADATAQQKAQPVFVDGQTQIAEAFADKD